MGYDTVELRSTLDFMSQLSLKVPLNMKIVWGSVIKMQAADKFYILHNI